VRTADEVIRIGYAQKARPLYFSGIEDSALVDDGSMIGKAEVIEPLSRDIVPVSCQKLTSQLPTIRKVNSGIDNRRAGIILRELRLDGFDYRKEKRAGVRLDRWGNLGSGPHAVEGASSSNVVTCLPRPNRCGFQ
jgi:hypothetical protein